MLNYKQIWHGIKPIRWLNKFNLTLTSALRALVNNSVKESFYGKRKKKKKPINVLAAFFISHKSDVKTFLKWMVNQCPKGTH